MNQDTGETRPLTETERKMEAAQLAAALRESCEVPVSEAVKDMVDIGRVALNRAQRRVEAREKAVTRVTRRRR